jgi:hypothetical protein
VSGTDVESAVAHCHITSIETPPIHLARSSLENDRHSGRQSLHLILEVRRHFPNLSNVVEDMIGHSVCLEAQDQGRPIDGSGSVQNHIVVDVAERDLSDFLREVRGSSNLDALEAPVSTGTTASGRPSLASLSGLFRFHLSSQFCTCITFFLAFECLSLLDLRIGCLLHLSYCQWL